MNTAEYTSSMPPGTTRPSRLYTDYHNPKYNIVSLVAFLIGVEKRHFENDYEPPKLDIYESLEKDKNARIVRNLCRIRTGFEQNYAKIRDEFRYNIKNIGSVPNLIPTDAVEQLAQDGISLHRGKPDNDTYLIAINKELSNRLGNCKALFPDWLNWDYIKALFLMPNGMKPEGLKAAWAEFGKDWSRYPYQCYINWAGDTAGNILYCDEKFVRLLYEAHEDQFTDLSLVKDVGDIVLDNIASFIENSEKAIVVVDCENSDPIKLAAALSSLSKTGLAKIQKVLLFDSNYTNDGWKVISKTGKEQDKPKAFNWSILSSVAAFPIERFNVPRLNERKSQVDMTLAANTCKEVYTNGVDSVILVSSDSDYWALIQTLSDVHFLVKQLQRAPALLVPFLHHIFVTPGGTFLNGKCQSRFLWDRQSHQGIGRCQCLYKGRSQKGRTANCLKDWGRYHSFFGILKWEAQKMKKALGKSPCEGCKRHPNCPSPCFPRRDWLRGQKKKLKGSFSMTEQTR